MPIRNAVRVACLAGTVAVLPSAAVAQTPAYVGTWAAKPTHCKLGQEDPNAPMLLRRDGYDQHEAHCTFKSVRRQGKAWAVKAQCEVEGDKQAHDFTFAVAGQRLMVGDGRGSRILRRCR